MIRTLGAYPFSNVDERMKQATQDEQGLRSISEQLKDVTAKLDADLERIGTMTKENFESYDCQLLAITRNFGNGVHGVETAVSEVLHNRLKEQF